jgi:hypothetical protein
MLDVSRLRVRSALYFLLEDRLVTFFSNVDVVSFFCIRNIVMLLIDTSQFDCCFSLMSLWFCYPGGSLGSGVDEERSKLRVGM